MLRTKSVSLEKFGSGQVSADIYRLSRMGTVLVVNKTSILHLYKVDSTPPTTKIKFFLFFYTPMLVNKTFID